jgi:hypothetical protein
MAVTPNGTLVRLATLFSQRKGQWVKSTEIDKVAGRCGWRTRISELRTGRRSRRNNGAKATGLVPMKIANRVRREPAADGGHYLVSEYRYE